MIGCDCAVCKSDDPRASRCRPSIYLETGDGLRILVDTTPDLRAQALAFDVRRVDAILFTHEHADHVMGLDDVRRYNGLQKSAIPCYANAETVAALTRMFAYVFDGRRAPLGAVPKLDLFTILGDFSLGRAVVRPVAVMHGSQAILGFRIGDLAYLTDCSAVPDASWPVLEGVRLLVLDALRDRPHPTHFSVDEALDVVARLQPERAFFTHICHDLPHAATCARLPPSVQLAYDGLSISFDIDEQ